MNFKNQTQLDLRNYSITIHDTIVVLIIELKVHIIIIKSDEC